ncbi:MAG: DNA primase [Oscillospiraceae bacterium]|nr:DNA primase [Oscillospiraceae bacterium]
MAFPPAFMDELIARNPIEEVVGRYVTLKRSGGNLFGLCPFHGEKTASFSVSPDKGIYYCFGCHKGGRAVNFMMEVEGLSYPDAVRALAKQAGMEVPEDEQYQNRYRAQERLWALHKEAARFFHSQLYAPVGQQALQYALGRGLSKGILTTFGVGYAPDTWDSLIKAMKAKGYTQQELIDSGLVSVSQKSGNIFDRFRDRLMFPVIDVRGNVIAFSGRALKKGDDVAKYLNSPETLIFNKRKNLFGLNLAKKTKQNSLILVEGNVDVVALHQYGFDNAVASLGTSLTEEQAALITRYVEQVILLYDSDKAGQNATARAIPILEKAGLRVKVLHVQDAKDPDEFLKKFGADKFRLLLDESANRVEYQLNVIRRKYDLGIDDQKIRYVQESAELISTLDSSVKREVYSGRVAEAAGISLDAMKLEVNKAFKRRIAREKKKQEKIDLEPVKALQPKTRAIRYDNVKSALAEESVIAQALRDPALLDLCPDLTAAQFSVDLWSKVYNQLRKRHSQGMDISLGVLEDLTPEETGHLAGVCQRADSPVNETAFRDCVRIIVSESQSREVQSDDDLLTLRNKLKESKGTKL